jgi:hypothetical protein
VSWFKGLFGGEEEATTGGAERVIAAGTPVANDRVAATNEVVANTGKKVKLNFKRIPKAVVQAMADETIGPQKPPVTASRPVLFPEGTTSIKDIFNKNADDITKPMAPMQKMKPMAPKP